MVTLQKILHTFVLSLFIFSSPLFSQEKLGMMNTSWSSVIPGVVVAEPAITSYGFCVATDGRMISAFSNKGVLLWEKSTGSSKDIKIKTITEDFVLLWDNKDNSLKLLNPSGKELWTKSLSYKLNKEPYCGRDGRFFLAGSNIVECYGINGICKWSIETKPQKDIPIQELPDGSIIVFLQEEDGKTKAARISPFGKVLEEITFAGKVIKAFTTKDGVFLIFSEGTAGMFSLDQGLSKNKWVVERTARNATLAVSYDSYIYLELYENKIVANKLSPLDGAITHSFTIDNINGLDLSIAELTNGGLMVADTKNCYLYSENAVKKWSAIMPANKSSTKWNYAFFTADNHLIFCMEDWSLNAYLASQNLGKKTSKSKKNYNEYYKIDTTPFEFSFTEQISRTIISQERYNILAKGYYGELEQEYTSDLYSILTAYLNKNYSKNSIGKTVTVFDKDAYGVESAFLQLSLYGTSDSAAYFAKLISNTTDRSYLKVLLKSISNFGYDPDGKILKTIENLLPDFSNKNNDLLKASCDAVYSICRFMGRPAFNTIGKRILKELLYPKYDYDVRLYAKETLEKIMKLDL